jgi:hypothetical protein
VILLQYSDVSQRKGDSSISHLEAGLAANGLYVVTSRSMARISRVLGARERVLLMEIRRLGADGQ